jgi:hypothetical protein
MLCNKTIGKNERKRGRKVESELVRERGAHYCAVKSGRQASSGTTVMQNQNPAFERIWM